MTPNRGRNRLRWKAADTDGFLAGFHFNFANAGFVDQFNQFFNFTDIHEFSLSILVVMLRAYRYPQVTVISILAFVMGAIESVGFQQVARMKRSGIRENNDVVYRPRISLRFIRATC